MKNSNWFGVFSSLVLVLPHVTFGEDLPSVIGSLTESDQAQVRDGEFVMNETAMDDLPWPKIQIALLVNAPAEVMAAIYNDHEHQPDFMPDMIDSRIIATPGPGILRTRTLIDLPWPVSDDTIITETMLSHDPQNSRYKFTWRLIQSDNAESADGTLKIEPIDETRSIFVYENLVVPTSAFAGLLEGRARDAVVESCRALKARAQSLRRNNEELLNQSLDKLREDILPLR